MLCIVCSRRIGHGSQMHRPRSGQYALGRRPRRGWIRRYPSWRILSRNRLPAIPAIPARPLRPRIHSRDQAQSIQEISKEINISIDHMLFVDDNPVEIEKVKLALPGITCLHIESPPVNFARQFEELRAFGKLSLTEEDLLRGRQYFDDR